jgi:hypothetical protein
MSGLEGAELLGLLVRVEHVFHLHRGPYLSEWLPRRPGGGSSPSF